MDNEQDRNKKNRGGGDTDQEDFVKIKVVGEGQNGVYFKLKKTTAFLRLKEYYSKQVGMDVDSLKFLLDGLRIDDQDTPEKLNLKDDDQIDVYYTQTGGGRPRSVLCSYLSS